MSMDTPVKTVETWLKSLDESLLRYVKEFKRLDFKNIKTLKFFTADDFDEFEVPPSSVHRRMIMNAVAKLQTPNSKLGLCTGEKGHKLNVLEPKRLSYVASENFDMFCGDDQENEFMYKDPAELMLDELEVRIHCTF